MKKRTQFAVFLIVLTDLLGWAVLLPILPFYAEKWGATPTQVGWLFSAYALAQLLASPVLGRLADRYGRKPVLLLSLGGSFLSFLGLALAATFPLILLTRILDGITAGNLPIAHACIADVTEESERSQAFGVLGIAYGASFLLGPALSAVLIRFGFGVPIMAAAGFSALSILITAVVLPSMGDLPRAGARESSRSFAAWGVPALLLGIFFVAYNLFTSGFALFAERSYRPGGVLFGPEQLGWLYAYVGGLGILIQVLFFGRVLAALGERRTLLLGFVIGAMGFGSLAWVSSWGGILGATSFAVLGVALLRPTLTGMLSKSVGPDRQGEVMGFSQSLNGGAQLFAPLISGVIIGSTGSSFGFLWTGLIASVLVFGAGVNLWLGSRGRSYEKNSIDAVSV